MSEGGGNLLNFNFTFVFVILNLMVLYFFLKRLLFKPVTEFMENRKKAIKDSIDNAEKMKGDAQTLKQKYEDQIKIAREEAEQILNEARGKANKEYDSIVGVAKQDATHILVKAREEVERERLQMVKEVQGQVAGLALVIASKVLEANMDTDGNRVLANKFIDEVGAA